MKVASQASITSFQLCFASLGGPLKTCMPFSLLALSVLKLAVLGNETHPDTTKLGKCLSGACGRCLVHHVLPVLCASANPLPDGKAAACARGEGLQDLASHSASSQVVSPWENHVGSPALQRVRAWAVCPSDFLGHGMCTSCHLLCGVSGEPAELSCLCSACAREVWQTSFCLPRSSWWFLGPELFCLSVTHGRIVFLST